MGCVFHKVCAQTNGSEQRGRVCAQTNGSKHGGGSVPRPTGLDTVVLPPIIWHVSRAEPPSVIDSAVDPKRYESPLISGFAHQSVTVVSGSESNNKVIVVVVQVSVVRHLAACVCVWECVCVSNYT